MITSHLLHFENLLLNEVWMPRDTPKMKKGREHRTGLRLGVSKDE